ncbi:MAG TPA: Clp protease N-terminal domain-containing protein [Candidatus Limnocylindria bacterium]|nr:Clp protease N-terminal domain-containing protein [Candidatus Limnocylindria bacterium]
MIRLASAEARRLGHNYVGTEHLLVGLVADRDGRAGRVLNGAKLELAKVRSAIEEVVGRGDAVAEVELRLSRRARRAISFAATAARRLGHSTVGSEHLLLGVVNDEGGIGAAIIRSLRVDPGQLEAAIWRDIEGQRS